jgi:hypothetical protein
MASIKEFYGGLQDAIDRAVARIKPYRALVHSTSNGKVKIQPLESLTPLDESFAQLAGFKLEADDEIAVLELNNQPFVLGKIQRSTPTLERFAHAIDIVFEDDAAFQVQDASGDTTLRVDTDTPQVAVLNGASLGGFTGESSSGTPTFSLNASTGAITGTSFNSPHVVTVSQSTADTTSTTSTSVLQTAATTSVNLPTGTWTIKAIGGCQFTHSANATALFQVTVGGTSGTARSMTFSSTVYMMAIDNAEVSSLSGTVTVALEYRSSTAGTTSARNPWLMIIATRTS